MQTWCECDCDGELHYDPDPYDVSERDAEKTILIRTTCDEMTEHTQHRFGSKLGANLIIVSRECFGIRSRLKNICAGLITSASAETSPPVEKISNVSRREKNRCGI